jgi:iron complex outermembrane receptor protein
MRALKPIFCFILLLSIPFFSFSQQRSVSGKVIDAKDNSPLAEATVSVVGKSVSAKTGADGSFTLSAPAGSTQLRVTYIGYADQVADITAGNMTITMSTSSQNLTDVVVIGYGSARRKDITGAVASVKAKDFNQGQITCT